jgi:hypothetical protein
VTNNGNIIVANNANFVQTGTFTAGTGSSFKVRKETKPVKRLAYVDWSSPMEASAQTLKEFSYGKLADGVTNQSATGTVDNRFFTYNNGAFVSTPHTGTFTPAGRGYQIRTPNDFTTTPQVFLAQFEGTKPNSGTVNYDHSAITGDHVLLGNPYPSAISIDDFLTANPGTTGTVYVWNSAAEMDGNGNYTGGTNYNTYAPGTGAVPVGSMNGFIPVGQGFFVERGTAASPMVFTDAMRRTDENGIFSKAVATDKFWLQLNAPSGTGTQLLLGFNAAATAGIDTGYDAKMLDTNSGSFYTKVNGTRLLIDSHASFQNTDKFDVFLNTAQSQTYTVTLVHQEGIFASGQKIYLRDKSNGQVTDLSLGGYSFTSAGTGEENRFEVLFQPGAVLGTGEAVKDAAQIYAIGDEIRLKATERIVKAEVYDMSGRLLVAFAGLPDTEASVQISHTGVVLVKVQLQSGKIETKKLMLKH